MTQRFRAALEHGGDHVVAALGYIENHLTQNPEDLRARAQKGALLVIQACHAEAATPASRDGYLRVGAMMVTSALDAMEETALDLPVTQYFAGVTLALVPEALRPDTAASPAQVLDTLIAMPRFSELDPGARIDALVCRHLLGRDGCLQQAEAIDTNVTQDTLRLRTNSKVALAQ